MYNKIKFAGRKVNPMLVGYPVAFYTAAFICYTIFFLSRNPFWYKMAFVANAAAVLMALIAALPGFIDWSLGIPEQSEVKATGLKHMFCNIIALLFFAVNLYSNSRQWNGLQPSVSSAVFLSAAGLLCTLVAGFLGLKLVPHDHARINRLTPEEIEQATHEDEITLQHVS